MIITFNKYQGTGNDFILIDNRKLIFPKDNIHLIEKMCSRKFGIGADGLILLENSDTVDFKMVYFNSDGNLGSMCGNGGRCIVHFANFLNIINNNTIFEATDGYHKASFVNVDMSHVDISGMNCGDVDFSGATLIDLGGDTNKAADEEYPICQIT